MEEKNNMNGPEDLVVASFLFAKALIYILKEGQGIVLDIDDEMNLSIQYKKVIVFRGDNQIKLYKCDQEYSEGTVVNMIPTPNEQ